MCIFIVDGTISNWILPKILDQREETFRRLRNSIPRPALETRAKMGLKIYANEILATSSHVTATERRAFPRQTDFLFLRSASELFTDSRVHAEAAIHCARNKVIIPRPNTPRGYDIVSLCVCKNTQLISLYRPKVPCKYKNSSGFGNYTRRGRW